MKAQILNKDGKEEGKKELPNWFSEKIREDIVQKVVEAKKKKRPYGPKEDAGERSVGSIRHARRKFKSVTGYGISRVRRKIMWRRGSRFYWQGANVSGTVGGRKAHPPKVASMLKEKKINKKEERIALKSSLAATTKPELLKKRYASIKEININLPLIVKSSLLKLKTKEIYESLRKILKDLYSIAIQKKSIRAGKGKRRGRRYKKRAGLLFVVGNEEEKKISGVSVIKASQVSVLDLYPLGRLTIYTEQALEDLDKRIKGKREEENETLNN